MTSSAITSKEFPLWKWVKQLMIPLTRPSVTPATITTVLSRNFFASFSKVGKDGRTDTTYKNSDHCWSA